MKQCVQFNLISVLVTLCLAPFAATAARVGPLQNTYGASLARRFLYLVDSPTVTLEYHNGPVLTGSSGVIPVYIVWYGGFSETDKSAVHDFLDSFQGDGNPTDVTKWWGVTSGFKAASGGAVAGSVKLAGEVNDDTYSLGKSIKNADLETLVVNSLSTFPANGEAIYFVFTSEDVNVGDFCMNSCASHFATNPTSTPGGLQLPYAWVGNPKTQCPGMCAWPFAQPSYMPAASEPTLPPNGDLGADAMIIQMAYMLAGTATNPFNNAFYQGDAGAPLEAGTACTGSFGVGAYPGYPGKLQKDAITGGSFNTKGVNGRSFVLPTLWDPSTRACTPVSS